MRTRLTLLSGVAAAAVALCGAAWAQTPATATADLNVRAGPGPQYEVVGVIPSNQQTTVQGCLEGSKWCMVDHGGTQGWAYSDYLMADASGTPVVVAERWADVGVPVVTFDAGATGVATGAIAGALVGGPVGAVAGAVVGAALTPPETALAYVRSNRLDPIYLDGEVVVGATLPETVELRAIPDYDYHYVYINGVPVLVNPQRQIVYVVR